MDGSSDPLLSGSFQHSYTNSHVQNGSLQESEEGRNPVRKQPKRTVVVEPLLIMYTIAGYPSGALYSQYFYIAVGKHMGIDVTHLNSSTGNQTCGAEPNDTSYKLREQVQAQTAQYSLYIELAFFIPGIIVMLLYGTYSDKVGRKLCFILPPIGSIIDAIVHVFIIHYELPLFWFFISPIGGMVFGGSSLLYIGIYSYLADTIPPEKRAFRMTIIDVLLVFLGGFISLGIGYFIREVGYMWPYLFVIGGKLIALLYAIFFIPETVPKTRVSRYKYSDILKSFKLFLVDTPSKRRWKLQVLTFSSMIEYIFNMAGIFSLWEMNTPLCWNSVFIGYYSATSDTIHAIGGVVGVFMKKRYDEHWLAVLGKASLGSHILYLAFVKSTTMMFASPILDFFSILSSPMTRTMMQNLVAVDEQGSLFAAQSVVLRFIGLFSGTMSKTLYAATLHWWEGLCFLITSIGIFLSMIVLLFYIYRVKKEKEIYVPISPANSLGKG